MQNAAGNYGPLSNDPSAALRVSPVARMGAAISDGRFSLLAANPPASSAQFPYLGATRSLDNENPPGFRTFTTDSGNFADLSGTLMNDGNPANSDPSASSGSAVDGGGGFNESPIWTFNGQCTGPDSIELLASWQNDDQTIFQNAIIVLSSNMNEQNLLITGNAQMYGAREDTTATDQIVNIVPVDASTL